MSQFNFQGVETHEGWNGNSAVNSYARKLWHGAKRNFYYRDNPSRAALLCKLIIAQFSVSEEADEARLMLHDIRMDIRKMAGASEKSFPQRTEPKINILPCAGSAMSSAGTKFGIAVAVVFLPLIGVARDGIIGIAVPEIMALLVIGALFRTGSKVRNLFR